MVDVGRRVCGDRDPGEDEEQGCPEGEGSGERRRLAERTAAHGLAVGSDRTCKQREEEQERARRREGGDPCRGSESEKSRSSGGAEDEARIEDVPDVADECDRKGR